MLLLCSVAIFYSSNCLSQQQTLNEQSSVKTKITNNVSKLSKLSEASQFPSLLVAEGSFNQRKYFKILKQPIRSSGDIFFDSKLGFLWRTNTPVFSVMLLKKSGLYTYNDNNTSQKINGGDSLAQIMMGAMSGDFSQLKNEFTVKLAPTRPPFKSCLVLTPKENRLANIIQTIDLCRYLKLHDNFPYKHQLILIERAGNHTEIDFSLKAIKQLSENVRAQLQ